MKNMIILAAASLLSLSSFAKTCVVATSTDGGTDYNNTIATYTNVESREGMILTVIKKDGSVMTDLNLETYYDGVTTQEEVDARTEALIGSTLAIISPDDKENQLTLTIGTGVPGDELLKSDVMSLSDLTSSKAAVFDIKKQLAVYCIDQ